MTRVVVTGGSGRLGEHVILQLLEQGYQVVNVDVKPPAASYNEWLCPFRSCNLSDYGQTFAALYGFDAVVHLAADPRPDSDHLSGAAIGAKHVEPVSLVDLLGCIPRDRSCAYSR